MNMNTDRDNEENLSSMTSAPQSEILLEKMNAKEQELNLLTDRGKEIIVSYGISSKIKLYVDMTIGLGGDKWPAAELFITFITDNRWKAFFENLFNDKRIIELGAGTGLGGMVIDKEFNPKEIIVSDIGDHVKHMKYNIQLNDLTRCKSIELDWHSNNDNTTDAYDIIVALECVYKDELFEIFIKTMDALSNNDTVIFLGLTRNFQNGKQVFWEILKRYDFQYIMIPQDNLPFEYHNEMNCRDCSIFLLSKKKAIFKHV